MSAQALEVVKPVVDVLVSSGERGRELSVLDGEEKCSLSVASSVSSDGWALASCSILEGRGVRPILVRSARDRRWLGNDVV